jgi:hypothetical protein
MEDVGIFYGHLVYFTVTWYILWLFDIFFGMFWYVLVHFGMLHQKNLATVDVTRTVGGNSTGAGGGWGRSAARWRPTDQQRKKSIESFPCRFYFFVAVRRRVRMRHARRKFSRHT